MSIVTRAEFAELCGKDVKIINVNISRKKLVVMANDKSLMDTDDPLNMFWIKNQKQTSNSREKVKKLEEENEELKVHAPKARAERKKAAEKTTDDMMSWDARKKRADALKAESAAEKEALQVQKLKGELMPLELVEQIMRINFQSIFKEYEAGGLNIASKFCDVMANGDRKLLGQIVDEMRFLLDDVIKRTKDVSYMEIENAINEYADTRSRGERK